MENGAAANMQIEDEMMNMVMQQSMSQFPKMATTSQQADDEAMLKQILEQTAKEAMPEQNQIASNDDSNMSVAVKTAVSNGYTLE